MKIKFQHIISIFFLLNLFFANAQKKNENIGTEVVNVVKNYTPTISDASKVKETPNLDEDETLKKASIKYNIFSFPVASTFKPAKGSASEVDKTEKDRLYNNYLTLGFGTYNTVNAALFITQNIDENQYIGGMIRHLSSQGNIKNVELDNKFSDTSIDLSYGNNQENFNYKMDLGYQNQLYNWYGLPMEWNNLISVEDKKTLLSTIIPKHTYDNFYIGANINFKESIFNEIQTKFNRFSDSYNSVENIFSFKPVVKFKVSDNLIKTIFSLDFQNSTFNKFYGADINNSNQAPFSNENSYFSVGVNPNFQILKDNLTVNIGIDLTYLSSLKKVNNGTDFGTNYKLLIFPKLTASIKVVDDLMIAYAGAEGGLHQNSYKNFTDINPFLSPTLSILPTETAYDIYAGLKGKLSNVVSYNIRGSYLTEKNKAFFKSNDYGLNLAKDNYEYGNSMGVVYDDTKTFGFFGELKADVSKIVSFGINGTFNNYSTTLETKVWNLPTIKMGVNLDVNITKKWFTGANLFYVGQRFDVKKMTFGSPVLSEKTLDAYFDANFNLGFKYNDRLTAFLKANNIANQAYQKWLNFPVQSFQLILGASYKFDF